MAKIEIRKRSSEDIACWKINEANITPNSEIETAGGVTVFLRVNGEMGVHSNGTATVYSILNPGKKTKLFGGNKAYEKVELYAIDQSSEFNAEWGLAGDMAIPCVDKELGVDCTAVAFGNYYYKIENYANFINALPFNKKGEISRSEIREFLRNETAGVIKAYLASQITGKDIKSCQADLADYCEELKEKINRQLYSKGLTVYTFVISKLGYDPSHEAVRKTFDGTKLGVKLNKIENVGRMDDIAVERARADIALDFIKAEKGGNNNAETKEATPAYVYCSRCGEKNEGANYCKKCGEKLNK